MILETFIARRLSGGGRKAGIMLRVATLCVAVSAAVMLVALGVANGFSSTITAKLSGFASDIQVTAGGSGNSYEALPVTCDSLSVAGIAAADGVAHVQRFAAKAGIIRGDSLLAGIVLKGFAPESDTSFLHKQMVAGHIPAYTDTRRNRDAVISQTLSRSMRLGLGDRFEVLFVGGDAPRRDRLRVAGIYDSGMEEFDRMTVIGDLSVVQRLNGWSREQIGGYEIAVAPGADREQVALSLAETLHPALVLEGWGAPASDEAAQSLEVATVEERYPQIFDWLEMLELNTAIVIVIMLVVAVVNMASGVLIVAIEQTRTIGILKALGMRNAVLQRIFILRSVRITLRGLLWGNLAGLVLCLVQQHTGWVTLDPENYMMAAVPVRVEWAQVVLLNLGTLAVITLAMALPAAIIARIAPDKSIRFQ
ncbi:ABC transporter permease [uncultured Rikenella sp.]|uniref:ABC transporter permease n=1 Tax=uncultured Rikenella sp. TaxID=368003 RepID=UPI002609D6B2|nr:ABC transporter permease [uncultured Rikenella sp.]